MFIPILIAIIIIVSSLARRKASPSAYKVNEPVTTNYGDMEEFENRYFEAIHADYDIEIESYE